MSSRLQRFSVPVSIPGPLAVLPRRTLRRPSRDQCPLSAVWARRGPENCAWSPWLAEWRWAWAVGRDACGLDDPGMKLWLARGGVPVGLDPRMLSPGRRAKTQGRWPAIGGGSAASPIELDRVWRAVTAMTKDGLGQVLALALLHADQDVFDFYRSAHSGQRMSREC